MAGPREELLYYFCRLQMPAIDLPRDRCLAHLERTFAIFQKKVEKPLSLDTYLDHLYPLDWFLASACLEGNRQAWELLFASRAGRSDCLLMDALRARAARL
ncbi:MAG TPA: sigma-70 family RNA polymerase sigma factor, partial [Gemmataceae bacterium]|nr:sigma-70 family RNA polymerase sigma factor [Gemmataceae bacterium]